MSQESLIKMANQIGAFFEAMPDREQAIADIAQHLHRSWESRMRQHLLARVDAGAAPDLSPIVAEALRRHRDLILPA